MNARLGSPIDWEGVAVTRMKVVSGADYDCCKVIGALGERIYVSKKERSRVL